MNPDETMHYMDKPITCDLDAERFIRALHADGKLYHFDDSPFDIPCFTRDEAIRVAERVEEMSSLSGFDPFVLACALPADGEPRLAPAAEPIFAAVNAAMQAAEEIGGPEGADYVALMQAIIREAEQRIANARAWGNAE